MTSSQDPDSNNDPRLAEFAAEHAKRDRHLAPQAQRVWAETLLTRLHESPEYRARQTPAARLAEQRAKLALLEELRR
jgi:hypothetical protein